MKRVLVTGGSGYLGHHVVPLLKKYFVLTLSQADLTKEIPRIKNVHAVVHLASNVSIADAIENPKSHIENNVAMTLSVLEACRAQKTKPLFVYVSSDRVYGKAKGSVTEDSPTYPIEPYVASKLMSETAIKTYANQFDIPYVIVRPSAFFGPHQPRRSFISDVIQKMKDKDEITTGPLRGVKNFTYAGNVADAVLKALRASPNARNRTYNIGGKPLSLEMVLLELKKIVEKKLHKKIKIRTDKSIKLPTRNEIGPFILSCAAAKKNLHWREAVSLRDGLERTVEFFLKGEKKI